MKGWRHGRHFAFDDAPSIATVTWLISDLRGLYDVTDTLPRDQVHHVWKVGTFWNFAWRHDVKLSSEGWGRRSFAVCKTLPCLWRHRHTFPGTSYITWLSRQRAPPKWARHSHVQSLFWLWKVGTFWSVAVLCCLLINLWRCELVTNTNNLHCLDNPYDVREVWKFCLMVRPHFCFHVLCGSLWASVITWQHKGSTYRDSVVWHTSDSCQGWLLSVIISLAFVMWCPMIRASISQVSNLIWKYFENSLCPKGTEVWKETYRRI